MIGLKLPLLVDNTDKWAEERFKKMGNEQKLFIQTTMDCCGYENKSDGGVGKCEGKEGCGKVIKRLAVLVRNSLVKVWIILFFLESVSICILLILNLKDDRKKSESTSKSVL
ncbi:hypothetical protein GVAV_001791 [Gurleya vavrai]